MCREVSDSISWQRFCRIPLGSRVPHPTTLMKITSRCGERAVAELNDALIAKAAEGRLTKMHKLRANTTVVEANVAYPVDSSLLAKGIARIAKLTRQAKAAGLATRTRLQDRSRRAHRRAREVVNTLRRRGELARDELRRLNAELAQTAAKTVREADAVVRNARRKLRSLDPTTSGRARAIIERLAVLARAHRPDRRPDPPACRGRHDTRGRHPPGVLARSRCPPHPQGTPRSAGRVRLQGPGRRQRRRHRLGLAAREGQPARRTPTGTRHRTWSAGAPGPKAGSAASNATSAADAPAWTPSPAPEHGPRTASSLTTSPRSSPSPPDPPPDQHRPHPIWPPDQRQPQPRVLQGRSS